MTHFCLDFETGGLDSKRHMAVQIGIALMEDGNVLDRFEQIIGPKYDKKGRETKECDIFALKISGITYKQLMEAPPPDLVVPMIQEWMKDKDPLLPVVAFNAPFDYGFYHEMLFMAGDFHGRGLDRMFTPAHPPLVGPWHCALLLAKQVLKDKLKSWSLDNVAKHFDLKRETGLHGALEDSILAGQIYTLLLQEMKK